MTTGVIIVDHGSRRDESNRMLEQVAALFAERFARRYGVVEPAHMELAEPSIATAFDRCVALGARRVVVMPYFLLPGRHWDQDIPALTAAASCEAFRRQSGERPAVQPDLDVVLMPGGLSWRTSMPSRISAPEHAKCRNTTSRRGSFAASCIAV